MFREIKKKHIILENRKPYPKEVCDYINELNKTDWIYSSLRLDGSMLTKNQVGLILKGEFLQDAPLSEHSLVERYDFLYKTFINMLQMSASLNIKVITTFAQKLSDDDSVGYRRKNPVLVSLSYNPPHPAEIDEQMELLMHWFYSDDVEKNPIKKAAGLHNRIIEIYPFDSFSEAVARASMYFFLMENGYPAFELDLSEREYNIAISEYLKKENTEPFYRAVEHSLFKKMEILLQLTAWE